MVDLNFFYIGNCGVESFWGFLFFYFFIFNFLIFFFIYFKARGRIDKRLRSPHLDHWRIRQY